MANFELAPELVKRVIAYANERGYFPDEAQAHDIFGEANKFIIESGGYEIYFSQEELALPLIRQAIDPIIDRVMTPKPKGQ